MFCTLVSRVVLFVNLLQEWRSRQEEMESKMSGGPFCRFSRAVVTVKLFIA